MLGKRHEIARLQSDFYRDKFRRTMRWVIVASFVILCLVSAIIYLILFQPKQSFYANTTDGVILPMPAAKRM